MDVSLRQLQHLVVLSEEAHFGRAAERLCLSQPALSRSIKAIEDRYGVLLVDRGPAGAVVTRTGEEVVRLAKAVLQNASHLDETLRAEAGGSAGTVYAGVAPIVASAALSGICARVLTTRPKVRLYTDVQPNASLITNLLSTTYDFILCPLLALGELHSFDLTPAGRIPFDMIVRAGHPLAGRKQVTLDDINAFPVIGAHTRPFGRQPEFDPGTSFFGLGPLRLTSDSYDVLGRVTQATDAIWMSSRAVAKEALESGDLVILRTEGLKFPGHVDVVVVTLRDAALSPATRQVMADMVDVMTSLRC